MVVFNIRRALYAATLTASGVANRWNKDDEFVIYTGGSIALATLELVAHRSGIHTTVPYKLLRIGIETNENDITSIPLSALPPHWKSIAAYPDLQEMGSEWYRSFRSLVLQVPSSLVKWEPNYLINTRHPDFARKVSIESVEDFEWDNRLL